MFHHYRFPISGRYESAQSRLVSEVESNAFAEGREFRTFYEFILLSGASVVIKFSSPIDFVLRSQTLALDSGKIRLDAIINGTEGGTFNTLLPVIGKNRMSTRPSPFYTPQVVLSTGGTYTGGDIVESVSVHSGGNTNTASTVGAGITDSRGLPAGTYYLKLTSSDNTTRGFYNLWWEERPNPL